MTHDQPEPSFTPGGHDTGRFAVAPNHTREQTAAIVTERMARLLAGIGRTDRFGQRYTITAARLLDWHRYLFGAPLFAHEAGRFSTAQASWAIPTLLEGRWVTRPMRGADPSEIAGVIDGACARFAASLAAEPGTQPRRLALHASADLIATAIATQPFPDGNHRIGLLAMSAALHAHHLAIPRFPAQAAFHVAIGWACRPDSQRSLAPLAALLEELVGDDA